MHDRKKIRIFCATRLYSKKMSLDTNLYTKHPLHYRFRGKRILTFEHSGIWIITSETLSSTCLQREGKLFTGPMIPADR